MLFLFYTNTIFSKFMKLNISTSLFKKSISSQIWHKRCCHYSFWREKHVWKQPWLFQNSRSIFFVFFHCRECYESIGSNHADTLVGFHVFTGCDVIGRFLGKSKALWWKTLNRHHKRNYARLQLWVNMKHCQVPVYLKVISNSLFNISLWFFPLYILAQ